MTVRIGIRFPWGRYHATQWGRHSNEAVVDWPPSPWRLLRGLYSSWKTRCADLNPELVEGLFEKLAGEPTFWLPEARSGHSRHYYPAVAHRHGAMSKPATDTVMTIDSFMAVDSSRELLVAFEADLTSDEMLALEQLCSGLSYLGRAESICEARVVAGDPSLTGLEEWRPGSSGSRHASVLCAESGLDANMLTISPAATRKKKHIDPVGTQWISYGTTDAPTPTIGRSSMDPNASSGIEAVRYVLGSKKLPSLTGAVAFASLARKGALSRYQDRAELMNESSGNQSGSILSVSLSGRQTVSERLDGNHAHAHYVVFSHKNPRIEDRYVAEIDTLVVYAPGGLSVADLAALARLEKLWTNDHLKEVPSAVRLAAEGMGGIQEVAPEIATPSRVWVSHTPFVPPRFAKKTSFEEHVVASVRTEMTYRHWLSDVAVDAEVTVLGDVDCRRFRTHRPGKEKRGQARRGAMVRIEFEQEVIGPIMLGRHAHLGLGLFMPNHGSSRPSL